MLTYSSQPRQFLAQVFNLHRFFCLSNRIFIFLQFFQTPFSAQIFNLHYLFQLSNRNLKIFLVFLEHRFSSTFTHQLSLTCSVLEAQGFKLAVFFDLSNRSFNFFRFFDLFNEPRINRVLPFSFPLLEVQGFKLAVFSDLSNSIPHFSAFPCYICLKCRICSSNPQAQTDTMLSKND